MIRVSSCLLHHSFDLYLDHNVTTFNQAGGQSREKVCSSSNLDLIEKLTTRHVHFLGPGLVSSVAYIDPGNWATDLSAGANYGYKLLFIVLLAGLAAAGEC
jgi:hypothetical protein